MSRLNTKQLRLVYWLVTPLFLLLQGWAAWQYFREAPRMTETITALGYPIYFMKILGTAKLLGIVAIATGVSPTLKEWAYAGFAFDVLGAFWSHLSAGDSALVALVPAAFFVVQLVSYLSWKLSAERGAARRRRRGFAFRSREAAASYG